MMILGPKHLIDLDDFSYSLIDKILELGEKIYKNPQEYSKACEGKVLASLFYEPSTRTQMSFQTAMLRLGGSVVGFSDANSSSVSKGESLKDTIKVVSGYSDVVVLRHYSEGSAKAASIFSDCPLINAGDGGHLHPTQTLTDLLTLKMEIGSLENLTIGLCGDLKNGRTVHSLIKTMSGIKGTKFVLISTKKLNIPSYIQDVLDANNCDYEIATDLKKSIPKLDVLYMTRIQRERFDSEQEYEEQKDVYILDKKKLVEAKKTLKILHPLPRVDEIDAAVDDDKRAIYFKQAVYGMYVRMALILTMVNNPQNNKNYQDNAKELNYKCDNKKCITQSEKYLKNVFVQKSDIITCGYCDHKRLI